MGERPFRYTKGKLSYETTLFIIAMGLLWRFTTWGFRRVQPVFYHPIALVGIALTLVICAVSPWLVLAAFLAVPVYAREWPDSYLRHVQPRLVSFLAGFKYRYRIRKKLTGCGLMNQSDPVPIITHVCVIGCTTRIRVKMFDGMMIEDWRKQAGRVAPAYNALALRADEYHREKFTSIRITEVTKWPPFVKVEFKERDEKPKYVQLEFLNRNPFRKSVGVEFMNFHLANGMLPMGGRPVAVCRTGEPYLLNLRDQQLLIVAMSRRGKSNAARTMLRAYHRQVQARLMEFWGIDGKGGVEFSFMQHLLTRYCYGDDYTDETAFRPEAFAQMLNEAKIVMMRRQRRMRTVTTKHTATPDEPWVVIMIDELLALTSKLIKPEIRNDIAANIALIQQQGIACGVTIVAFSQLAQKEEIPFRGGFTEFQVGRSEAIVADMLFGTGSWKAGARVDEIPKDLPGVFYAKNDFTLSPEQFRYVETTDADVRDLAGAPESALWDSREVVVNLPPPKPEPKWENPPDPPLESPLPDLEEEPAGELVSVAAAPEEFQPPPEPPPVKKSGPSFGGMR
jgi:hypothetical protein